MKTLRLFFAIPIPQEFQKAIQKIQQELFDFKGLITWVKPEQVHITLRFLGNQPEEKLSAIIRCSREIIPVTPKFELADTIFKLFPSIKNPRVLLFDFKKGRKEFLELQKRLDEGLLKSGLIFKNPKVAPHLTVGRIKEKALPSERQALVFGLSEAIGKPPRFISVDSEIKVQEIHLIQSQLTPKGPTYTILNRWRLN